MLNSSVFFMKIIYCFEVHVNFAYFVTSMVQADNFLQIFHLILGYAFMYRVHLITKIWFLHDSLLSLESLSYFSRSNELVLCVDQLRHLWYDIFHGFAKDGVLAEDIFWDDVETLLDDYESEHASPSEDVFTRLAIF